MTDKTNVLLITSDQQHWSTLGVLDPDIKTPNLDRLANEGMLFNRAYCPNPTCTPTRASIITGVYPSQHGAWSLGTKLKEDTHTVGEDFKKAGYATALIGKAHFQQLKDDEEFSSIESNPLQNQLDYWRKFNGPFYGFDHIELARNHADEFHVGQHYGIWMEEKGFSQWRDCFQKPGGTADPQTHNWNLPEEFHYDTWIAERTNAMLDKYKAEDQPFFLWASFPDPHPPYLVSSPWDTMYNPDDIKLPDPPVEGEHDKNPPHFQMSQQDNPDFSSYSESGQGMHGFNSHTGWKDREVMKKNVAIYYGMISMMDHYIGKILDHLDETGLTDSTMVVFTSDHGHFYGQHGLIAKGPFHYDDVTKVPFIVRQPNVIPANTRSDALLTLVDMAPTMLGACGIDVPRCMVGKDQMPVFKQEAENVRDHVVVEHHHEPTTIHVKTLVQERYKLTTYLNQDYGELFDLQEDPGEINNLWDDPDHEKIKAKLVLELLHAEMGKEPMWMPRVWGA